MDEILALFTKRNIVNLLVLAILILALPIGIALVRQQQVIQSRAREGFVKFIEGQCIKNRNGQLVAVCSDPVSLQIFSPLGGVGSGGDDNDSDDSDDSPETPNPSDSSTPQPSTGICDPKKFDKNTWEKTSDDECEQGKDRVKVTYQCQGKKKTVKEKCAFTQTPKPSKTPKGEKSFLFQNLIKKVFAGHNQDSCAADNSCNACIEAGDCDNVAGQYCDNGRTCFDLLGGAHSCSDEPCGDNPPPSSCDANDDYTQCGIGDNCSPDSSHVYKVIRNIQTNCEYQCTDLGKKPGFCGVPSDSTSPSGDSCKIGFQSPALKSKCVECIVDKHSDLPQLIKDKDPNKFNACSDQELLNYWCNGGVKGAQIDCSTKKKECSSVCLTSPSPTSTKKPSSGSNDKGGGKGGKKSPSPSPSSSSTIKPSSTPSAPEFPTVSYKFAETPDGLLSAPELPYDHEPIIINTKFSSSAPGIKTIFVEFKDKNGKTEQKIASINLVGPDPVITAISCNISLTTDGISFTVTGNNLGTDGNLSTGPTEITVTSWKNDVVKGVLRTSTQGQQSSQTFPVVLTRADGAKDQAVCEVGALVSVDLGAKIFCRENSILAVPNVEFVFVENTPAGPGAIKREKVTIARDGRVQGLTTRFEVGKTYTVYIKAIKSLRRAFTLTPLEGTNIIPNFSLPVGDIFPLGGGDGKINALDKAELIREWGVATANPRPGDFNVDGRVNSIDWACMRFDFGQEDAALPQ